MFEKTFSFWRRLVANEPAGQAAVCTDSAAQQDRRLWVRHETDLAGKVQLAGLPASEKLPVVIRDLSLGGTNLLLDRPFEAGELLSLELPAGDETRTVLACVVRASTVAEGQWSLGCVFSRELSSDDLAQFGAKKVPASGADLRKWVRFPCETKATFRLVGDPSDQLHPAEVLNLSASGIGLVVTDLIETGSLLNLDLIDKQGRTGRTILACVVHTTLRQTGELAIGCNFISELNEEELQSLL